MNWDGITRSLYMLPGILLGLTIHEFCHAFCAWKLGDNTALEQGRVTLNPLKHIDVIGLLFILIAGFGWAKPVQFNPANLKNYRRDKALIAAVGPVSNLFLGVIFAFIVKFVFIKEVIILGTDDSDIRMVFFTILLFASSVNLGLFIFNLLPIPPLDGSHIVFSGLNIKPDTEDKIRKLGMPLLLIIIVIQNFTNITIIPIGWLVEKIMSFIWTL